MLLCYSYCCCYWCWSVCRPVFVRPPLPDITFPGQSPQRAVHRYQTIFTWCPVTWLPTVSFPTARWVISIENKALSACPILPFLAKYHIMIYNIIPIRITLCSAILMKVTKKKLSQQQRQTKWSSEQPSRLPLACFRAVSFNSNVLWKFFPHVSVQILLA